MISLRRFGLDEQLAASVKSTSGSTIAQLPAGDLTNFAVQLNAAQVQDVKWGRVCIVLTSAAFPMGHLKGLIAIAPFVGMASLSQAQVPGSQSSAGSPSGFAMVLLINPTTIRITLTLTGVTGQTSAALVEGGAPDACLHHDLFETKALLELRVSGTVLSLCIRVTGSPGPGAASGATVCSLPQGNVSAVECTISDAQFRQLPFASLHFRVNYLSSKQLRGQAWLS